MKMPPSELDIFHSNNPFILLSEYDSDQLMEIYGYSTPEDIALNIWKKHGRIDLIQWIPKEPMFYDYKTNEYLNLSEIQSNRMSIMAQSRLIDQMGPIIINWSRDHPIWELFHQIKDKLQRISQLTVVVD